MEVLDTTAKKSAIDWLIQETEQEHTVSPIEGKQFTAGDWALAVESISTKNRHFLWQAVPDSLKSEVLSHLHEDARSQILSGMEQREVVEAINSVGTDKAIDILQGLSNKLSKKVIKKLSAEDKEKIVDAMSFPADKVGRFSNRDVFTFDYASTVGELMSALHNLETMSPKYIFLVDSEIKFQAMLGLHQVVNLSHEINLSDIPNLNKEAIRATEDIVVGANQLRRADENALAVVNEEHILQGKLTAMTAIDILTQAHQNEVMHLAKMDDEDLFAPVKKSAMSRAVWLGINLMTAFLAAWVIGLFEATLDQIVALAVLMPIVASMGGIAGSQTLTLTIRGLAMEQLSAANISVLAKKETWVVVINGLLWALVVGIVTQLWFENTILSVVIFGAIVVNMFVTALSGIFIPYFMEKFGIDPALAGSVVLTTVSDVVGFFVFLGCASLFLL